MEDFRENIEFFTHTGAIENILIGIAYWLAVIVVILFVFFSVNRKLNLKRNRKL